MNTNFRYIPARIFAILVFILLIGGCAASKKSAPTSSEPATLLWKIEGNGLSIPSFLYGTIHIIPKSRFVVSDTVKSALESSDLLLMEIKMDDTAMIASIQSMMNMPGDTTIESLWGKEKFARYRQLLKDTLKLDIAMFNKVKPIFLSTIILTISFNEPVESYEMHFTSLATVKEIPVEGLESAAEQMKIFDNLPLTEQAEYLEELLLQWSVSRELYDQMATLYIKQDLNSLHALTMMQPEMKAMQGFMLDDRNIKWIPDIKSRISKQKTFIAVGAGHLLGDKGLVNLLRQEGYTVTAVQ